MNFLIPAAVMGIIGLITGSLIGVVSELCKTNADELQITIRNLLPGFNCGACGYPGCDGLAKAIANGEAAADGCPVGRAPVSEKISGVLKRTL